MNPSRVPKCLFANELMQIYTLFKRAINEGAIEYNQLLNKALPKNLQFYMENINMQEFRTPPASPRFVHPESKR